MTDLRHLLIDIEDQRHYNSCIYQALSTYMEAIWCKFKGVKKEFSPAFGWMDTKGDFDNTGVFLAVAMDRLTRVGLCLESTYPYTDENTRRMPPKEAYKEAKKYRIGGYLSVTSPAGMRKWLDKGLPVVFGMKMPDFRPTGPIETHAAQWLEAPKGKLNAGHCMVCFGYTDQGFIVVNSYGKEWGDNGCTITPESVLEANQFKGFVITRVRGMFDWIKGFLL